MKPATYKPAILVVDVDKTAAHVFGNVPHDSYQVFQAASGAAALEILHNHQMDLILAANCMPDMTGVELFTAIEKQHIDTAKVLLTGSADDVLTLIDAINSGTVDKYITKLSDKDHILRVIHELLDTRMQRSLASHRDAEKQLQHAKMATLGELVTGILHEINNPLSFIHANLGNLLKFCNRLLDLIDAHNQIALSDEARAELAARKEAVKYDHLRKRITELIESSLAGVERMTKIIQEYKSFSRMSNAGFAEADIHTAIDSTLALLHHQYKDRIEIKKHYGAIPPLCCSIAKLNQVFMNLLVNAIQAIEGLGAIEITTSMEPGMVVISIRDTGCGMSERVLKKVFEPFFTTKPDGVGTGLGLSIINEIMKQHHGRISVESFPGAGSTFTLKLPVDLKANGLERQQ